jgi:hypothetical protein
VGTAGAVPLSYQQPTGDQRSVRDFGAKGDGVSDDTKAFQQTVDAGPGGIVIPHGTYCLDQTIKVDLDRVGPSSISGNGTATLLMKGKGPTIRFNGTHGGTASPATVNPNIWERQRSPMVDGIEIVGQNEDAVGIQAVGTMQMTLSRLVIRKTKHALHFTKRNRNVLLTACHLYENRGIGLFLDNVDLHQINVTGAHISYNAAGGIVLLGGAVRNLQV